MARGYWERSRGRKTPGAVVLRILLACSLALLAFLAFCPGTSRADDANQPLSFDYESRTGFPLAVDDRKVTLDKFESDMDDAIQYAGQTKDDWNTIRAALDARTPEGRQKVRIVRVWTDQPVYIYRSFILLPDPKHPEDPVDISQFDVDAQCDSLDTSDPTKPAARCISIHRDHRFNRDVTGVFLAARTIIIRGQNHTGGLNLVTMSENLYTRPGEDLLDLSARQDPAPTLGTCSTGQCGRNGTGEGTPNYNVFQGQVGSTEFTTCIDDLASRPDAGLPPGPDNPWTFEYNDQAGTHDLADLDWQLQQSIALNPHDWDESDPCRPAGNEKSTDLDQDTCYKQRDKRGLAGLPRGHVVRARLQDDRDRRPLAGPAWRSRRSRVRPRDGRVVRLARRRRA